MSDNIPTQSYNHLDLILCYRRCEGDHIHACGNCYKKWFLKTAGNLSSTKCIICPVCKSIDSKERHMQKREQACDICCQLTEHHKSFHQEDSRTKLANIPVLEVAVDGRKGEEKGQQIVEKCNAPTEKKPGEVKTISKEPLALHEALKKPEEDDKPLQMEPEEVDIFPNEPLPLHDALKKRDEGPRSCPYKGYGCSFWGTPSEIADHVHKQCLGKGSTDLKFLTQQLTQLDEKVPEESRRECPHKKYGCPFWGSDEDIDEHLNRCQSNMISILLEIVQEQDHLYQRALSAPGVECIA